MKSQLRIREYKVNIDKKEKKLCLVGEVHTYNHLENEIGKKLIEKYNHFASEGLKENIMNLPKKDFMFLASVAVISMPKLYFSHLGAKRNYPSISRMIESNYNGKLVALEKNPYKYLTSFDKMKFLGAVLIDAAFSPLAFFRGKSEQTKDISPETRENSWANSWIKKRDKEMAGNIADILRGQDVNNLLATFGMAHLEGITNNLSENIKMTEIKEDMN